MKTLLKRLVQRIKPNEELERRSRDRRSELLYYCLNMCNSRDHLLLFLDLMERTLTNKDYGTDWVQELWSDYLDKREMITS